MKDRFWLLVCVALFTSSTLLASTKVISLRADLWCPYTCESSQGRPGYMVEIMKAIFEPKGFKVDYEVLTWARALSLAQLGEIDGVLGADKIEAKGLVFPSLTAGASQNQFFVLSSNSWRYSHKKSLESVKVGVVAGYSYDPTMNSLVEQKNSSLVFMSGDNPLEQMIKMLKAGRLQSIYENEAVMKDYLLENKLEGQLVSAGGPQIKKQNLYVAFSPKRQSNQVLAKTFDQGLRELRKTGELKKILKKYGLDDWQ